MTYLPVRKDNDAPVATRSTWEPHRLMRELMSWDPFREMTPYFTPSPATFSPSFEVKETKEGYVFKADLPGIKESDLDISVTGNRLTLSGKREAEKREEGDTFYTYERSYGSFTRSFTLPDGVDMTTVHADLKDGVLALSVKKAPEAQPKKIAIQSQAKKS